MRGRDGVHLSVLLYRGFQTLMESVSMVISKWRNFIFANIDLLLFVVFLCTFTFVIVVGKFCTRVTYSMEERKSVCRRGRGDVIERERGFSFLDRQVYQHLIIFLSDQHWPAPSPVPSLLPIKYVCTTITKTTNCLSTTSLKREHYGRHSFSTFNYC